MELVGQTQGNQACDIRQWRQAIEERIADVNIKTPPPFAGGHHQTGYDIILKRFKHAPGIGRHFNRMFPALPCCLDPYNGLVRQHIFLFQEKHVRIVIIGGKGHHGTELLNGSRVPAP